MSNYHFWPEFVWSWRSAPLRKPDIGRKDFYCGNSFAELDDNIMHGRTFELVQVLGADEEFPYVARACGSGEVANYRYLMGKVDADSWQDCNGDTVKGKKRAAVTAHETEPRRPIWKDGEWRPFKDDHEPGLYGPQMGQFIHLYHGAELHCMTQVVGWDKECVYFATGGIPFAPLAGMYSYKVCNAAGGLVSDTLRYFRVIETETDNVRA